MQNTIWLIFKIISCLKGNRKWQISIWFFLSFISALLELLSLGSVLPFITLLTNPSSLSQIPYLNGIAATSDANTGSLTLLFLGLFVVIVVSGSLVKLASNYLNFKLSAAIGSDLGSMVYRHSLHMPYQEHIKTNSSALINSILQHVAGTVSAINQLLSLLASVMTAIFIYIGLLMVNWRISVASSIVFGGIYLAIAVMVKSQIYNNALRINYLSQLNLKSLQEGMGALRDIIISGTYDVFAASYEKSDRLARSLGARNQFLSTFPKFLTESVGLLGIASIATILVYFKGPNTPVMAQVGVFALGAQKLLPAFQNIFGGWSALQGFSPSVQSTFLAITSKCTLKEREEVYSSPPSSILIPAHSIEARDICFAYNPGSNDVLKNITVSIPIGTSLGLVGATGSGKSTFVDIIMGLIPPTQGKLLIDGNDVYGKRDSGLLNSWRSSIAHVPQTIFLSDSTISENIAFGVPLSEIDYDLVRHCSELAKADKFIDSLDNGYQTFVGERGVRLSGGQRQRLGIARALYRQSSVLVLDEATSALDVVTESQVMDSILSNSSALTLIIIAHRLTTLDTCDRVIGLRCGQVVADGAPAEVLGVFNADSRV